MTRKIRAGTSFIHRFRRETASVAALEFALIAPLLILMGIGAIEFSSAVRAEMQVDQVAHTVANLISNQAAGVSITAAQLKDFQYAGKSIYNYGSVGTLSISAASVNYTNQDPQGNAIPVTAAVGWDASNAAGAGFAAFPANVGGSPLNVITNNGANGLQITDTVSNDSVIVVTAVASFNIPFLPNFFGRTMITGLSFETVAYARPRYQLQISKGF